ncbi:hypothetical protein M427DRAFT_78608, partial [Gonapodya prolifera JEL478]
IDGFIDMGRAAMQDLAEQRGMLKSTHSRLLTIANSLGLSTSVVRFIESRARQDRALFLGGVVMTLLFVSFCLTWLR